MGECENCGVPDYWEFYGYLSRFCFNCRWDKQPERKDLPDSPFKQYELRIKPVTKESLEKIINIFNQLIEPIQKNQYASKQDIIDRWYEFCSEVSEQHDLDIIGIKYYELEKPYPSKKKKNHEQKG